MAGKSTRIVDAPEDSSQSEGETSGSSFLNEDTYTSMNCVYVLMSAHWSVLIIAFFVIIIINTT